MKQRIHESTNLRIGGFTFVELLVVVTIIAVLTAVGAVAFAATNRRARDSKRLADMEAIRSALEICRAETGSYPVTVDTTVTCDSQVYLNPVPEDPKEGQGTFGYNYTRTSETMYSLCAELENINLCTTGVVNPCCLANP